MQNYKITITNVADHRQRFPRVGASTVEYMEAEDPQQVENHLLQELKDCGLDLDLYSWTIEVVAG